MTVSNDCLTILQLTDLHLMSQPEGTLLGVNTARYFQAVLAKALADHPQVDVLLLTGDLVQDITADSYRYLLACLEPLGVACLCLPGNHDDVGLMTAILAGGNIRCDKQAVFDKWQLICLNSQIIGANGGHLDAQELAWLDHCLQSHPQHNALIAVHHHCVPARSAWMDTMMIGNSDDFLAIVGQHVKTKLIVNGHVHQVMDEMRGDIRILATPSTCFQFTPLSAAFGVDDTAPGYRVIKLFADGNIDTAVVRLPGRIEGLDLSDKGY